MRRSGQILFSLLALSTTSVAQSTDRSRERSATAAASIARLKFRDVAEVRIEASWRPKSAVTILENGDIVIPSESPVQVDHPRYGGKVCMLASVEQKVVFSALKGISSARELGVDSKGSFFVFLKLKTGKTVSVALPVANDDNGARHIVFVDNHPASIDLTSLNEVRRLAVRGGCVPSEPPQP